MNARSTGSPAAQDAQVAERQPIGGLAPEELHAIAILGKEAGKWRDSLAPGSYPVDVLLRIDGNLEVGEEQSRVKTSKPELLDVLAFSFEQLGPRTRTKLAALISEAFGAGNGAKSPPQPRPEIRGLAQSVIDLITARESKSVRGNVAGKLNLTRYPPKGATAG